jgi:hypothetical protein
LAKAIAWGTPSGGVGGVVVATTQVGREWVRLFLRGVKRGSRSARRTWLRRCVRSERLRRWVRRAAVRRVVR